MRRGPDIALLVRRSVWQVAVLVSLALVAGCVARPRVLEPQRQSLAVFAAAPQWQQLIDPRPAAPGTLAWLGGDVASSVQAGPDRWLWIFGDTLLGTVRDDCPDGVAYCDRDVDDRLTHGMIANTVGVMTRRPDGGLAPLDTHWRMVDGEPRPIFEAEAPGEFLWPLSLAYVDGVLLVAASRHTRAMGLASLGDVLLRVTNPEALPQQWVYDRTPVPHTRPDVPGETAALTWATALVPRKGAVYLFGRLGSAAGMGTVVARFPTADLGAESWVLAPEYLQRRTASSADLVWTTAFDGDLLYEIPGLPGTSEATITFDERLGWITYRIEWMSHTIALYTAADLMGPWTARGSIYEIPPPEGCVGRIGDEGAGCVGVPYFAYAAKAHPSWAGPGTKVVSYNVNVLSADLDDALRAAERARAFYIPRLIAATPTGE